MTATVRPAGCASPARIWHRCGTQWSRSRHHDGTLTHYCGLGNVGSTLPTPIWHLRSALATPSGLLRGTLAARPWTQTRTKNLVPNTNHPHSLCWSMKHKEWGRWVRFRAKSGTAASWGQNHPLLRPRQRLHLRPLAASPPLAVLWPDVPTSPWCQPAPAHKSLRSGRFIAPHRVALRKSTRS